MDALLQRIDDVLADADHADDIKAANYYATAMASVMSLLDNAHSTVRGSMRNAPRGSSGNGLPPDLYPVNYGSAISDLSVFELANGQRLINVHPDARCEGRPCVIHRPTEHSMRSFQLYWRDDSQIFERICDHGIGHPDPDQFEFWDQRGLSALGVHGCDGCCRP